jgi:hypothetical protein
MKTDVHLWQFLAEFFLELEVFQIKVVEKIRTHILCPVLFPENSAVCDLQWKNWARQAKHDSIIRRMLFAHWIAEATLSLSEYVILIASARQ